METIGRTARCCPSCDAIFSAFDTTAIVYQIKPDGSLPHMQFPNSEGIGVNTLAHVRALDRLTLQGYLVLGEMRLHILQRPAPCLRDAAACPTDEFNRRLRVSNTLHHAGCFDDRSYPYIRD